MTNNIITERNGIKDSFLKFYKDFYKKKVVDIDDIKIYLDKFNLSKASSKMLQDLNKEVTEAAIDNMKGNKTSGADGFTALFYKRLKGEISPIFTELIKSIIQEREMPKT